jgi:hypothetical protein
MAAAEREIFIDLSVGLRIRYRRSQPPPPITYAITLELSEDGDWTTIRLWDNADDPDEHHEHVYRRASGKQPPTVLRHGSANEAMAAAIREAKLKATDIVQRWEKES